jgi:hypothetical protein
MVEQERFIPTEYSDSRIHLDIHSRIHFDFVAVTSTLSSYQPLIVSE